MKKTLLCSLLLLIFACTVEDEQKSLPPEAAAESSPDTSMQTKADSTSATDDYQYQVAQMTIETEYGHGVWSKEKEDYQNCTVSLTSNNPDWCYEGTGRIRGRGNSTWYWYEKKPYRLKLDKKHEMLGLAANKDWVLLANYRDPTDMMNTLVFIMGQGQELPYTNHTRYVEVTLDGDYVGLYQLTEQIETGKSRVDIDENEGYLIALDKDDGPELSPGAGDNFWSTVYRLPICVKSPDDVTTERKNAIRADLARLERAIQTADLTAVEELMDVDVFIEYMLIQELVYNVEVDAPRSVYMHKDVGGRWVMGPLWDFDAGYDFDWSTMYTGHNFFSSYRELVLGTDPARHIGGYYVNSFFTDLWHSPQFVARLVGHWRVLRERVMADYWPETLRYYNGAFDALKRDYERWPIDKRYALEISRMERWLRHRVDYFDQVINAYPGAATGIKGVKM